MSCCTFQYTFGPSAFVPVPALVAVDSELLNSSENVALLSVSFSSLYSGQSFSKSCGGGPQGYPSQGQ